jgi:hypothetical protein
MLDRRHGMAPQLSGDFYLQLYTVLHGISPNFAFYTVSVIYSIPDLILIFHVVDQLTIQNGASIFGRILPNLFADKVGLLNSLILMSFGTGVLVFSLFGVTNIGGVTVFAILYGFFSGGGPCSFPLPTIDVEPKVQYCHYFLPPLLLSLRTWVM